MALLDLFIKKDENTTPKETEKKIESPSKFVQNPPNPAIIGLSDNGNVVTTPITTAQAGVVDNEILDTFNNALATKNLPGNDYYEFRESIIAMKDIPLDERNKFISAFRTLAASDKTLDKKKLVDSINFYLGVLNSEKEKFDGAKNRNLDAGVNSKLNQIKANNEQINSLVKKINDINEQITAIQAQNQELNKEANENQSKINNAASSFEFTYGHIVSEMQNDLNKINNYIS